MSLSCDLIKTFKNLSNISKHVNAPNKYAIQGVNYLTLALI